MFVLSILPLRSFAFYLSVCQFSPLSTMNKRLWPRHAANVAAGWPQACQPTGWSLSLSPNELWHVNEVVWCEREEHNHVPNSREIGWRGQMPKVLGRVTWRLHNKGFPWDQVLTMDVFALKDLILNLLLKDLGIWLSRKGFPSFFGNIRDGK